jgi:hypothetical protein
LRALCLLPHFFLSSTCLVPASSQTSQTRVRCLLLQPGMFVASSCCYGTMRGARQALTCVSPRALLNFHVPTSATLSASHPISGQETMEQKQFPRPPVHAHAHLFVNTWLVEPAFNQQHKKTPRTPSRSSTGCHKTAGFRITPSCLHLVLGGSSSPSSGQPPLTPMLTLLSSPLSPRTQYTGTAATIINTTTPKPSNGSPWPLRPLAGARPPAAPPTSSHLCCGAGALGRGRGLDRQQRKEEWSNSTRCIGHH